MKRLVVVGSLLLIGLFAGGCGESKKVSERQATRPMELAMRVSMVPVTPRVGQPVSVLIRPYSSALRQDGTCCQWLPTLIEQPLRVEARSPNGHKWRIAVGKTVDPLLWQGGFVFQSRGPWEVVVARDKAQQESTHVVVVVRPRTTST